MFQDVSNSSDSPNCDVNLENSDALPSTSTAVTPIPSVLHRIHKNLRKITPAQKLVKGEWFISEVQQHIALCANSKIATLCNAGHSLMDALAQYVRSNEEFSETNFLLHMLYQKTSSLEPLQNTGLVDSESSFGPTTMNKF